MDDFKSVAVYFETEEKDPFLAGKFFYKSKQFSRALKHLLRCPLSAANETSDPNLNPIEIAIKAVSQYIFEAKSNLSPCLSLFSEKKKQLRY